MIFRPIPSVLRLFNLHISAVQGLNIKKSNVKTAVNLSLQTSKYLISHKDISKKESFDKAVKRLETYHKVKLRKQRKYGILKMLIGFLLCTLGIKMSISISILLCPLVFFGMYWILIGALDYFI